MSRRRRRQGLTIQTLPLLRDDIARRFTDYANNEGLTDRSISRSMAEADLWWVAAPMCDIVQAAVDDLPDDVAPEEWAPAPAGIIIWEAGTGLTQPGEYGDEAPQKDEIIGAFWTSSIHGFHYTTLVRDTANPLGVSPGHSSKASPAGPTGQRILRWLLTTWVLADQPTVTTRQREYSNLRRHWAPKPEMPTPITVTTLRRLPGTHTTPANTHGEDDDGDRLGPTVRFLVRGHWRSQPCGPKRSKRKPIWVSPFIKGPEGAPFKKTDNVKIWRR